MSAALTVIMKQFSNPESEAFLYKHIITFTVKGMSAQPKQQNRTQTVRSNFATQQMVSDWLSSDT